MEESLSRFEEVYKKSLLKFVLSDLKSMYIDHVLLSYIPNHHPLQSSKQKEDLDYIRELRYRFMSKTFCRTFFVEELKGDRVLNHFLQLYENHSTEFVKEVKGLLSDVMMTG